MFPPQRPKDAAPLRGYIEGYYGRLLRWEDRKDILTHMGGLGMQVYLYAPKEDPYHRHDWRFAYDDAWQDSFRQCCGHALNEGITMIGGIAPGLDYDYRQINTGRDWTQLLDKCMMMHDLGAGAIALLLDDIQPCLMAETEMTEGAAHANLANALYAALGIPLLLTPRIYADEVMHHDMMDAGPAGADDAAYWPALAEGLNPDITLLICGEYVVAPNTQLDDTAMVAAGVSTDRTMIWDNLYAHDYCPRRLYLGPWRGRDNRQDILLNPTGMVATDKLLLSVMAAGEGDAAWRAALAAHGVPDAFHDVAHYFDQPPPPDADDDMITMDKPDTYLDALDALLWRWKTPLAQEWYPFMMGLRQDILYAAGRMDKLRQRKSYPPILRGQLKNNDKDM